MYRVPSLLLAGRAPTRAVAPLRCHLPCGLHFSTTKRRPTISESLSAGSYAIPPRQPQASNASKKAAPEPVDPATANFFEWRKMPQSQKWAHLGTGAFPLVPARESQYEDQTEGMHLAHGVAGLQRLFMEPATIHRIVGFESDLYEESKRDSTATAEVAFVGRSNVGKSSLMNALLLNGGLRKQLATTSKTPGRTQLLFMFSFKTSRDTRLVDCPGYGFAKASKGKMETWNVLMGLYLRRRNRQGILKRVMVLIDVRRGIGPLDEQFLQFLESEGIAYQIVLTKCDLMTPRNFRTRLEEVREHLRMMPAGKFTTEASKRDYESQQQTFDAEEEEDEQWQRDVNSGKYAVEREITRGNSDSSLPDFSCCVPVIHAVSSRHEVGLETLQQSLTKMLTLEKNHKKRPYQRDDQAGSEAGGELTNAQADYADIPDDGMDNPIREEDDDESWAPPIPVSHYQETTPEQRQRERAREKKQTLFSSKDRKRSKFGARSGARGFATSAKPAKRATSAAPASPAAATSDSLDTPAKKRGRPRRTSADEAPLSPEAKELKPRAMTSKQRKVPKELNGEARKGSQPKRSKSAPPIEAARPAVSEVVAAAEPPPAAATRSTASTSSADAHLGSIYQKKSQRQHILDRSETYIGSMHHQHSAQWVYSESTESGTPGIVQRECVFVPSLVHIFDEILVNAADNQHRVSAPVPGEKVDPASAGSQTMSMIRVDIDPQTGCISIFNDGASIPVATHPTENIPIPELIFGHLLTSSNYNDQEQRFTGGRHGYGAKLTNIFSSEFRVEVQDVARGKRYTQTFRNNMSERDPPKLESFAELLARGESKKTLASNYTRISFIPDFKRFGEKGLSEDTVALMKRRVFDVAACVNTNIQMAKQTKKSRGDDATGEKTKKIKIFLNGVQVEVDSFPKYLDLFPSASQVSRDGSSLEAADGKWVFSNVNEKWQIAVGPNVSIGSIESKKADSVEGRVTSLPPATRDISFVNSIYTSRGGTHVNHVADRITRAIVEHILKQHKTITKDMLPAGLIKQHMSILVNCKIPNPSFSSQTKESLMTPVADFKSECTLSQSFLASILAPSTGIVPAIVDSVVSRQQIDLLRKSRANANKRGKLLNIPKLDDAHWAGSSDPKKVKQTTLILTEGDSAKALVLSSLSILGRDRYGVFPLKGKLLNVRDASLKQVMENAEIQNILAIVGLEIGAKYHLAGGGGAADGSTSPARAPSKPLRYGRIMLMTDQDHDGSHIKGLFLNLLHTYWPDLLKSSNFLEEFVTAIIKVRVNGAAGKTKDNSTLSFQTQIEFEQWKSQLPPDVLLHPEKFKRLYTVKYYKGLGTNTNEEGKEYFRNMDKHRVKFVWQMGLNGGNSGAPTMKDSSVQSKKREVASTLSGPSLLPPPSSSASDWIRLAFSKDQADARKEWLQTRWHEKLFVDTSRKELAIEDFINKELIVFSHADNIRSIPSLLDGLKPVQRKILYGCFKKKLQSEIKVAQLSGYISEQTMYHHGEVSLQGTIVNMAQSFIGSNNLALLVGAGQFGSRNTGGKDAAAARYIFTSLSPITRVLFHPHDDPLLTYKDEDGFLVEPEFYLPVLPVVLVNGAEGIGTGFSTAVPTYNPLHLIENLRLWLNDRPLKQLHPWTRGWKGVLKPSAQVDGEIVSYQSEGIIQQVSPTSLEVRELPLGRWPEEFKSHLASLQSASEIKRFKDECTDERILYRVEVTHEQAKDIERVGVMKFFKLTSSLSLNNMHLFNGHNLIRKYRSAVEVLKEFAGVRLEYYRRRREHLLIALQVDLQRVQNKKRFISLVTSSGMVVYNRKKQDLIQELVQLKFETAQELLPRFPIYANHEAKTPIKWTNTVDPAKVVGKLLDTDSFDYLLQMPLSTLTAERLEALQSEYDSALAQVGTLTKADAKSLWLHDLQKLEEQLLKGNAKSAAAARTIDAEVIEQE